MPIVKMAQPKGAFLLWCGSHLIRINDVGGDEILPTRGRRETQTLIISVDSFANASTCIKLLQYFGIAVTLIPKNGGN